MAGSILYRLRCGRRVWSRWCESEDRVWKRALELGLAVEETGRLYPGPLVWIEKGARRYARSRTIPMTAELDGRPLRPINRDPFAPRD